ncbi:MAG: AraC family transcriptional regulator [Pedobacter sp.]|nr:MAG: AraC family transcriptional regulator [Pedobacter sp.]
MNRITSGNLQLDEELKHSHRHDHHIFVLQDKGTSHMEIDFEKHLITEPSIFYQSPNQVHRALKIDQLSLYVLIIDTENIADDYRKLLSQLSPVKPLPLEAKDLDLIERAFSLGTDLCDRTEDQLYFPLLRETCNTIIALFISQYLKSTKPANKFSRFEIIEKAFSELLENHFLSLKRPSDYAEKLNISVAYLNECIKQVTGLSASHQIQQRAILEAKRLLYHSSSSIKEIATALGYADHAYFSRFFTKVTGMTAMAFRRKNHD